MPDINYTAIGNKFIVAHDGVDIYRSTPVLDGSYTSTGLPFMEVFDNFDAAYAKFGDKITNPDAEIV